MLHDITTVRKARAMAIEADAPGYDVDGIRQIADFFPATLESLCGRIDVSRGDEQLVYREVELDEVWRLLEAALEQGRRCDAASAEIAHLTKLRDATMAAHDLVGDATMTRAAAACLRAVLD